MVQAFSLPRQSLGDLSCPPGGWTERAQWPNRAPGPCAMRPRPPHGEVALQGQRRWPRRPAGAGDVLGTGWRGFLSRGARRRLAGVPLGPSDQPTLGGPPRTLRPSKFRSPNSGHPFFSFQLPRSPSSGPRLSDPWAQVFSYFKGPQLEVDTGNAICLLSSRFPQLSSVRIRDGIAVRRGGSPVTPAASQ